MNYSEVYSKSFTQTYTWIDIGGRHTPKMYQTLKYVGSGDDIITKYRCRNTADKQNQSNVNLCWLIWWQYWHMVSMIWQGLILNSVRNNTVYTSWLIHFKSFSVHLKPIKLAKLWFHCINIIIIPINSNRHYPVFLKGTIAKPWFRCI